MGRIDDDDETKQDTVRGGSLARPDPLVSVCVCEQGLYCCWDGAGGLCVCFCARLAGFDHGRSKKPVPVVLLRALFLIYIGVLTNAQTNQSLPLDRHTQVADGPSTTAAAPGATQTAAQQQHR